MVLVKGTLADDLTRWINAYFRQANIDEKSENTLSLYKRVIYELEDFLLTHYSDITLKEIDNDILLHFLDNLEKDHINQKKKKFATNTKILYGATIKSLFSFISKKSDCKHSYKDATMDITPKKKKKGSVAYLSTDEVNILIKYLDEQIEKSGSHSSYINSMGIKLMVCGGLRISEALNRKVTDFKVLDFVNDEGDRDCYIINLGKTKTGEDMTATIMMNDINRELEYFNELYEKDDDREYIFIRNSGSRIERTNFYYTAKRIMEKAGVYRKGLHIFRHTSAMELYRATGDILVVKSALNHKNLETTMIYADAEKEDVAKAMRKIKR